MTQDAQLKALWEWLGWTKDSRGWIRPDGARNECNEMLDVSYRVIQWPPPPLTLDLMYESEVRLSETGGAQAQFIHELQTICGRDAGKYYRPDWHCCHATKEQRLEVLLRAVGKWVDEVAA